MKLSLIYVTGALTACASILAVAACAGNDDPAADPPPTNQDGATFPPNTTPDDAATAPDVVTSVDAGPRECSDHGLCHTNLPEDTVLKGVWADGTTPNVAWAVSAEGHVLRWDGATWIVQTATKKLGPLHAIWGTSATDFWVGGDEGVYHATGTTPAAVTFALEAFPANPAKIRITSIWGLSATDVYAAGTYEDPGSGQTRGRLLRYTPRNDAGPRWAFESVSNTMPYHKVWGSAATGVWVSGQRPIVGDEFYNELVVLRRPVGATRYTEIPLPIDPDDGLPFAKPSTNQGAVITSDSTAWIFVRNATGRPVMMQGASADSGKTFTWTYVRDGDYDDPPFNAVSGTAANDAWVVGDYGRVRRWDGTSWSPTAVTITRVPVIDPFYSVWSKGSTDAWLVGDNIALHYDPSKKKASGGQ